MSNQYLLNYELLTGKPAPILFNPSILFRASIILTNKNSSPKSKSQAKKMITTVADRMLSEMYDYKNSYDISITLEDGWLRHNGLPGFWFGYKYLPRRGD